MNKPKVQVLNATPAKILNTIKYNASQAYKGSVPDAIDTLDSLKEIGNVILGDNHLMNEFASSLYNRIASVQIASKLYSNPLASLKQGVLDYGETIEEIFISFGNPHEYDPKTAEAKFMEREIPDVSAAYHSLNYRKFYKTTIQQDSLRMAFTSMDGLSRLISGITDQLYTAANYDEYIVTKYLLANLIATGKIAGIHINDLDTAEHYKEIAATLRGTISSMAFMNTKYTMSGVPTYTDRSDLIIVMDPYFEANFDVQVLAYAFNMDRADFTARTIIIDSFSEHDEERLKLLLGSSFNYISEEDKAVLAATHAVVMDKNFLMLFDNLLKFTEDYNGEGLYFQYWLHEWKTISASPFKQAVAFNSTASAISAITVSPSSGTMTKGASVALTATVTGTGIYSRKVSWSISGNTSGNTKITATGPNTATLTFAGDESTAVTAKATSEQDAAKSGEAVFTPPET